MRKNKSHSEKKNASIRDLDLSNRLICDKKMQKDSYFWETISTLTENKCHASAMNDIV